MKVDLTWVYFMLIVLLLQTCDTRDRSYIDGKVEEIKKECSKL